MDLSTNVYRCLQSGSFCQALCRHNGLAAANMLNDWVVPWFEEQGVGLLRILTDRGTEYCGKVETHDYQLYLAL